MGQHPSITSIRRLIGFELALSARSGHMSRIRWVFTNEPLPSATETQP
jgi:hypothetical protein